MPLTSPTVPVRENLQPTTQNQTTRIQISSQATTTPIVAVQPPLMATLTSPQTPTKPAQVVMQVVPPQQQQQQSTVVQTIIQPQQGPPKKGLSLTVIKAKEMELMRTKRIKRLVLYMYILFCSESKCKKPKKCSELLTKSRDQRKLSFWDSWLVLEVSIVFIK